MGSQIFEPISNSPTKNLEQFIYFCRYRLDAFGADCWENNQWKTKFNIHSVQVRFSTDRFPSNSYNMNRYLHHLLSLLRLISVILIR